MPILASVDFAALVLVLAAMVAVFRFRAGPVTVLVGCATAGLVSRALGLS